MTKRIKICDKCNKEVDWLYNAPKIWIEGYFLKMIEGNKMELCKNCMNDLINIIENFYEAK